MATPPNAWLHLYLRIRRPVEVLLWVLIFVVEVLANTQVVLMDIRQHQLSVAPWEVLTWEASSNVVWLALLPALVWMLDRKPLGWATFWRSLPWHVLASGVFCAVHVAAMVALRKAVYALHGSHYEFGPWAGGLHYEALKDIRSYFLILGGVSAYRLLLWRWQGEASWLNKPDGTPDAPALPPAAELPAPVEPTTAAPAGAEAGLPQRFLVRKLGKEFLLPMAEIEWVQACGNYVNLHRQQHDYPLRSTLAAIEPALVGLGFVRVHRSYLVNLHLVQVIEPTEAGDARLRLRDGSTVPCSRTHLDALRKRLARA